MEKTQRQQEDILISFILSRNWQLFFHLQSAAKHNLEMEEDTHPNKREMLTDDLTYSVFFLLLLSHHYYFAFIFATIGFHNVFFPESILFSLLLLTTLTHVHALSSLIYPSFFPFHIPSLFNFLITNNSSFKKCLHLS